jgi:hypothetical protein
MLQPRPLKTDNRFLRAGLSETMQVSLGRAVSEMAKTPMTGTLLSRKFEQAQASISALTTSERDRLAELDLELQQRQYQIEYDLETTTDPILRESLQSQLKDIYEQDQTQRSAIHQQSIDEGRMVEPEELNEMYDGIVTFTERTSAEEARLIAEGKKEEIIRNAIINRSPEGLLPGVAKFGGGMLAMAADPVEVATMFIPVVGQAGKATSIARFGRVGGRARVGAIEGTAGALLTEPLYYGLSADQQLDYTMSDALFNVGAGFFLGGAIGTVAGMFSRPDVDVKEVIASVEPTITPREDVSGFTPPPPKAAEEIVAKAPQAAKQARSMYQYTGGQLPFEIALRQYVTDHDINVQMIKPKVTGKPVDLGQFVRDVGGINDNAPAFRGELSNIGYASKREYRGKTGKTVNGINNPNSKFDLDDMAEFAFEAGYISSRNTNELVKALDDQKRGSFVFARQDAEAAEDWRKSSDALNDFDAEQARRQDIKDELKEKGVENVTDDEIVLISDEMARSNKNLMDARIDVARDIEEYQADLLARHAIDPRSDPTADPDASAKFDEWATQFTENQDIDDIIAREEVLIKAARDANELTSEQIKELDAIEAIELEARAYIETIEETTVCVMRS